MLAILEKGLKKDEVENLREIMDLKGHRYQFLSRYGKSVLRIFENIDNFDFLGDISIIDKIVPNEAPYFFVSRKFKFENTIIPLGNILIGGKPFVIGGPCAVESYEQVMAIASFLKGQGVQILRGGAYKPRTSPYSFQGLELEGLKILRKVADKLGMYVITEALDTDSFSYIEEYADIIQIGARNMQNFSLLKRAGKTDKPVLLKRGFMSTIDEFLASAEYIVLHGNQNVILCERGIRTYETRTRFTLDISAIPVLKELSHLPVVVDPSHAAGRRSLVLPLAKASLAAGADGIMIEVHNNPEVAVSDGKQSLTFDLFERLIYELSPYPAHRKKELWPFREPSLS